MWNRGSLRIRRGSILAIAERHLRWLINLWQPFLGAGTRVTRLFSGNRERAGRSLPLSDQQIEELRQELKTQEKIESIFAVDLKDETGAVIAEVQEVLHIRKRTSRGTQPGS